jgi:hypothetical protein
MYNCYTGSLKKNLEIQKKYYIKHSQSKMLFSGIVEKFSKVYMPALNGLDASTICNPACIQMVFSFSPVLFQ